MIVAGKTKNGRDKGLALYRRAKALGVSPSHLSRVISGQRESVRLLLRLQALLRRECGKTPITNHQPPN